MVYPYPKCAFPLRAAPPLRRFSTRAFTLMELLVVIIIIAALAALVVSNVDTVSEQAENTAGRATMETVREAFSGSPAGPGYLADMKHFPNIQLANVRMHQLLYPPAEPYLYNRNANRGWRGPYLKNPTGVSNTNAARNARFPASDERRFTGDATFLERGFFKDEPAVIYGLTDELAVGDAWGNPIVVQVPPAAAFSLGGSDAKRLRYMRIVSAGPDGILATPADRLAGMLPDGTILQRGDDIVVFLNRADAYEPEENEVP